MPASSPTVLRQAVMPHTVAIAQSCDVASLSLSLSTCGSLFSRVPLPFVAATCRWLHHVDLLNLFRVNRTLVAVHHHTHIQQQPTNKSIESSSSSPSPTPPSSFSFDWVASAWYHISLRLDSTRERAFPDIEESDQPAHFFRLVLAATPHLRHLTLHADTYTCSHMADMADTLDMLPALRSLEVSSEADDCTNHVESYIPLPAVLARHPRLHTLQCTGYLELSVHDIVAIGSHPSLAHINVLGVLHCPELQNGDDIEIQYDTRSTEDKVRAKVSNRPCTGCVSDSSVSARLGLLRHVQQTCIKHDRAGQYKHSPTEDEILKVIAALE